MQRRARPWLAKRPITIDLSSLIPVSRESLQRDWVFELSCAMRGPVTYVRDAQADSGLPVYGFNQLDAPRGIATGHENAGTIVVIRQKLRRRQSGVMPRGLC